MRACVGYSLGEIEVNGYDREGNRFSTLNGLDFKWESVNRGIEGFSTNLLGYQQRVVLTPTQDDQSKVAVRCVAHTASRI